MLKRRVDFARQTELSERFMERLMLWGVGLMTSLTLPVATAQDNAVRSGSVLEEIVVTATKRVENLQDVGIAVTALSGEQMEALGFANAQEVTAASPGVSTIQPNGESNYSLAIRGVANSDFTTNVESPVALYLDEVYISQASGSGFQLFDMERVEILRGPQGTLFGRNSTGGLAHFITRKPTEEFHGYGKITLGDYDQLKLEGAINVPLGNRFFLRASLATHENDGYIENRNANSTGDLNNADDIAWRLQGLLVASDTFEVLFNIRQASQDIDTGFFEYVSSVNAGQLNPNTPNPVLGGYIDNDGDVFAGDYDRPGFNELELEGYSATIKWAIGDKMNLTAISDLSTTDRQYIEDTDASPIDLFNFYLITDAEQFSQEVRLDYESDRVNWVVGLYYLDLEASDINGGIAELIVGDPSPAGFGQPANPVNAGAQRGLYNPYTSELASISVFGQVELKLSEQLDLILGARYIEDEKDFTYSAQVVEYLNPNSTPGFHLPGNIDSQLELGNYTGDRSDDDIALRLQLDWNFADDGLAYVSFNRGIKGGGFNAPIFPPNPPLGYNDATFSYAPEQLDAFEVGLKVGIGEIGRLNLAAYHYDYSDYQLFIIVGVDTITQNADGGEATGFEVELQLTPGYNWDFLFGFAYNDAQATLPSGGVEVTPVQSPEINFNLLGRYAIPIGSHELAFQFDANYRDRVFFALNEAETVTQDGYWVANASVSFGGENWRASAFVRNLFDEEYLVQTFDLSSADVFGLTEQYYGRPQWWGVSFRYDF